MSRRFSVRIHGMYKQLRGTRLIILRRVQLLSSAAAAAQFFG